MKADNTRYMVPSRLVVAARSIRPLPASLELAACLRRR